MPRSPDPWSSLALAGGRAAPGHAPDPASHVLHLDEDAVCPRCLLWIEPTDIVRRTAYGPAQHEACPAGIPAGQAAAHGL
ncbi:MAG TPA: hypothetical protein VNE21_01345 [Mycobacteriales bacterium]|nr:hypothetical protein [Mycobacteriales bacterium]